MKQLMKKSLIWLAVLVMTLSCLTAFAQDTEQESADDRLTVASATQLSGRFFTDLWGNNASDIDVRRLLHGYNLVSWQEDKGCYTVDESVVSGIAATQDSEGNRTYTIALYDDLYYSDGSRITAADYAFSILFQASEEAAKAGADTSKTDFIYGVDAYRSGRVDRLPGVRLLNEKTLSVTIKAEYLPDFYELSLLSFNPYPISVIAPGMHVVDKGYGVSLQNIHGDGQWGSFTVNTVRTNVLNEKTGYMSHPTVVSGPYTLTSFDGTTAQFELNPYYKGNARGEKPAIRYLTYTLAGSDAVDLLADGQVDLLNRVTSRAQTEAAKTLVENGGYASQTYPRSGASFIYFCCENPAVSSARVRQAIAMCLDKDALVTGYVGDAGVRVDGYYGIGQWMYQAAVGQMAVPLNETGENEDWTGVNLEKTVPVYALDTDAAAALIAEDGWALSAKGNMVKRIGNGDVALNLVMLVPEGNGIAALMQTALADNLEKINVHLEIREMPMTQLLRQYYGQEDRDCDMIYLASNFADVFDPAPTFEVNGFANYTRVQDAELYQLALDMRRTEAGDLLGYCQKWLAFQKRFAEVLPAIPVYSNNYTDVYTDRLQGYDITANPSWGLAVVGAQLGDPVTVQPAEEN